MQEVNERQVGGDHYQSSIQTWDYCIQNGIGGCEWAVIKYMQRARKKHPTPLQDYKKALHYTEKLIDSCEKGYVMRSYVPHIMIPCRDFVTANKLTIEESSVVAMMTHWRGVEDLRTAQQILQAMVHMATARESHATVEK